MSTYHWAEWEVLDWLVFEAFEDLDEFLNSVSQHIDDTHKRRASQAANYCGSPSPELFTELDEIERQVGRTFSTSLAYAVVLLTYSHCEFYLKQIADLLCKERGLKVGLTKFRGDLTERTDLFLKAYSLPPLPASERQGLRRLALVRNCIAHNAGIVAGSRDEQALRKLISSTDGLSLREDETVLISQQYCTSRAASIKNGLRRLLHELFAKQEDAGGAPTRSRSGSV